MSDFSFDLTGVLGAQETVRTAENSTNKKAGMDMEMDDFLKLMVAQFQNQSIDDTADTTEMMNQMVQMSVIQAVTDLNKLMTETTNLTYAASLVGKQVTVGIQDGSKVDELAGTVTGTGTLGGKQVIFLDDGETPYYLTDIMAVGRLPEIRSGSAGAADADQSAAYQNTQYANPSNQGSTYQNAAYQNNWPVDEDGALG